MATTAARPITGVRNAAKPTTVAMATAIPAVTMDIIARRTATIATRMATIVTSAAITTIETTAIVTAAIVIMTAIGVVNATGTTTEIDRFPVYRFLSLK